MSVWADINAIFGGGWPPSEMDKMDIDELMHWRELAIERSEANE